MMSILLSPGKCYIFILLEIFLVIFLLIYIPPSRPYYHEPESVFFDQPKHEDFWEAGNYADTTSEKERDLTLSRTGPNPYKEAGKFYRQVEKDVYNTRQYILAQLRQILNQTLSKDNQEHLISVIEDVKHYISVTEYDIWRFHKAFGLHAWQENEMKKLSDLIQHRIHTLQNPPDCESAKKILCNFPVNLKARGIGSQLHHLSYCFLAAYGTQRTLIINRKSPNFNMEPYFLPISETCINASIKSDGPGTEDSTVVNFPDSDRPVPRPNYFPRSVPKDFAERLMNAHGDPFAWWMGQFFKYFMRMTGSFQAQVEKLKARIGYEKPIVGVQVRRTDKLVHDSRLIELEEYMEAVDDFFDDLELRGTNVTTRRIYLATDDPKVIQEAKEKYPNYDIVFNEKSVATASLSLRRTEDNVRNFMADIYFLSRSDFLVCGMSSNICRLAYELMQTLHPDASRRVFSVDSPYWFHYQSVHEVEARYPHSPRRPGELELQKGDRVKEILKYYSKHRNYHDGFLAGVNMRTGKTGLYPVYKTVDVIQLADTPSFDRIDRMEGWRN